MRRRNQQPAHHDEKRDQMAVHESRAHRRVHLAFAVSATAAAINRDIFGISTSVAGLRCERTKSLILRIILLLLFQRDDGFMLPGLTTVAQAAAQKLNRHIWISGRGVWVTANTSAFHTKDCLWRDHNLRSAFF